MKFTKDFDVENKKVMQILCLLFALSIVLIPVDNLPYMSNVMGELGNRGAVYPFILIIPIIFMLFVKRREIYFNRTIETDLLAIFMIWICISSILNMGDIFSNSFKGRSGLNKFVLQFMVVVFMLLVSYCTEILIKMKNITVYDFRRYIAYSLIPVFIYGTIEMLNFAGILDLSTIIEKLSSIFQMYYRGEVYPKGIRAISGEVSYFAMYAAFAMPWIISYIFTETNKKNKKIFSVVAAYLMLLLVLSKSRTAYAIIFIEIFLYIAIVFIAKTSKKTKIDLAKALGVILVAFFIINNTKVSEIAGDENSVDKISINSLADSLGDSENMSNVARMGMQKAALSIGLDNPIIGVGIGQYGFDVKEHLSDKALTSHEVQRWVSEDSQDWPPAFSLYPRILAEQGFIGFILGAIFMGYILIKSIIVIRKKNNDIIGITLIISFIGVLIAWINADTFAQVPFWILLPFMIRYNNGTLYEELNDEKKSPTISNKKENKFSLIIATCGRKEEVDRFLDSVNKVSYDKSLIEVIIVDQNKKMILDDIINAYRPMLNILHIKSDKIGLALNRNIGLEKASGDIVAFPDDDCEYLEDTLKNVNCYFNNNDVDILMGRIIEKDGSDSLRKWPKENIEINKSNFYKKCSSITMFLKKDSSLIEFNEKLGAGQYFGACEDTNIIYKNCKKEGRILYNPEIKVYHPHYCSDVNMGNEKIVRYGLGFGAMVKENFDFNMSILFIKAEGYHLVKSIVYLLMFKAEKSKRSWIAFTSRVKGFMEYK